jgi:hypothetical protein
MPFDPHDRARFLIDQALVENLAVEDERWLRGHKESCAECREYADISASVIRGLCSFAFEADPLLDARVRNAVDQRLAVQRSARASRRWALAAAALVALAAVPIYQQNRRHARQDADARILDSVAARVARRVPTALETLQPAMEEQTR